MTGINNPFLVYTLHGGAEAKQIVKKRSDRATEELVVGETKGDPSTLSSCQCNQEASNTRRGAQPDVCAAAGEKDLKTVVQNLKIIRNVIRNQLIPGWHSGLPPTPSKQVKGNQRANALALGEREIDLHMRRESKA